MAGAVPAIGCRGEPGPEEIAAAGGGIRLVPPADPEALAAELRALLDEPRWRRELGAQARATVAAAFTWERCGAATVAAYEEALRVSETRAPSCSSPTTRRRSGSARSRELHEHEDVVFALVGGGAAPRRRRRRRRGPLPFPRPAAARSGRRAARRVRALPRGRRRAFGPRRAARRLAGARRAGVPFVLWATIWAHPRTAAHALSYLPLRHLYRDADAIVTYGPHVSAYVRAKGARGPVSRRRRASTTRSGARPASAADSPRTKSRLPGRLAREKGVAVLLRAWRASGLSAPKAALVLVGDGPFRARAVATGAVLAGELPTGGAAQLLRGPRRCGPTVHPHARLPRAVGARRQRGFRPGGSRDRQRRRGRRRGRLVRHEQTGLVVPAGDAGALAAALRRLHDDPPLRARLGAAAREAVRAFTTARGRPGCRARWRP